MEDRTDDQLLAALAEGDAVALTDLFLRHQPKAVATARHLLGNQDDVDETLQEAYLRVFQSARGFGRRSAFSTWLHRIIVNLCRDRRRRVARQPLELEEDVPTSPTIAPDAVLGAREAILRVRQAIAGLPECQRVAIVLHRFELLTHDEIAAVTGWSVSSIEALLVRAYRRLRQALADLR